jgi:predicted O-methyltransferase YrrM
MIEINFGIQNRLDLIQWAITKSNAKNYLEIGCNKNEIFSNVFVENKIGVDPKRGGTLRMTSDEFFKINTDNFDVIFVDGLHEYSQVSTDVYNSLNCLNDNGYIIIHDMLPRLENQAVYPMIKNQYTWLGDVWRLAFDLQSINEIFFYIVLIDQGCGILKKNTTYNNKIHNNNYNWNYYANNFKKLPLITFEDFIKIDY